MILPFFLQKTKFEYWTQFLIAGSFATRSISKNRQLAVRLLAGAWCLACFVLVTAYSSVLVACITAPDKFKPIINSINDLPNKPEVHVVVNKNFFPDLMFRVYLNNSLIQWMLYYFYLLWCTEGCNQWWKFWNFEIFGRRFKSSSWESVFIDWSMHPTSPQRLQCLHLRMAN